MTDPKSRKVIVDAFIERIKSENLQFDVICGVATGAIAWAVLIAERIGKPFIYARTAKKEHGKGNTIEGRLQKGYRVLVIEDVVTTAKSSKQAIENIREAGGVVSDCVSIFSYGIANFQACRLIALIGLEGLLETALAHGKIVEEEKEKITQWADSMKKDT